MKCYVSIMACTYSFDVRYVYTKLAGAYQHIEILVDSEKLCDLEYHISWYYKLGICQSTKLLIYKSISIMSIEDIVCLCAYQRSYNKT